jgi:hypothetical protein
VCGEKEHLRKMCPRLKEHRKTSNRDDSNDDWIAIFKMLQDEIKRLRRKPMKAMKVNVGAGDSPEFDENGRVLHVNWNELDFYNSGTKRLC